MPRRSVPENFDPYAEPDRWEFDPTPDLADPPPPEPAEARDPRDMEDTDLIDALIVIFTERAGLTLQDRKVLVTAAQRLGTYAQALLQHAREIRPN